MDFTERSTRVYRTKQLYTKEELAAREALCVHEQPAFCAAACPLRLDARELLAHAAQGELGKARAMLERATPFPAILAAGCEAPCRAACRLSEVPGGQAVDIPAIERAAMRHGVARTGKGLLKFKKKKTAAVFGAELFTLVVAGELAGKSYPTKFYVAERSAEELIEACAPFLSAEERAAQAALLDGMDLKLIFGAQLTPEHVRGCGADIVCVSRAVHGALGLGEPDGLTLCCEGGVLAQGRGAEGVIRAFYDARRAGVSADRLAQGMSPDNARGEEGPVESRLYTDLSEAVPGPSVPEGGGYSPEQAAAEAAVKAGAAQIDLSTIDPLQSWFWIKNVFQPDSFMSTIIPAFGDQLMGVYAMAGNEILTQANIDAVRAFLSDAELYSKCASVFATDQMVNYPVFMLITTVNIVLPSSWSGLFTAANGLFLLPLLAAGSQLLATKLTPTAGSTDPNSPTAGTNKFMMYFFPIFSLWICATSNAAFSIYWVASNVIQIIQTIVVNKWMDAEDKKAALQKEGE